MGVDLISLVQQQSDAPTTEPFFFVRRSDWCGLGTVKTSFFCLFFLGMGMGMTGIYCMEFFFFFFFVGGWAFVWDA